MEPWIGGLWKPLAQILQPGTDAIGRDSVAEMTFATSASDSCAGRTNADSASKLGTSELKNNAESSHLGSTRTGTENSPVCFNVDTSARGEGGASKTGAEGVSSSCVPGVDASSPVRSGREDGNQGTNLSSARTLKLPDGGRRDLIDKLSSDLTANLSISSPPPRDLATPSVPSVSGKGRSGGLASDPECSGGPLSHSCSVTDMDRWTALRNCSPSLLGLPVTSPSLPASNISVRLVQVSMQLCGISLFKILYDP